jgi:hypothetical protein
MTESAPARDQVLVVNVAQRGGEILDDPSTAADVVLGDWSPFRGRSTSKMDFDPDRIAAVLAHLQGKTPAVFDTAPDQDGKTWAWCQSPHYPGRRIRFHGVPSVRFAAQVGADAPVTWRQGEAWPVKVVSLDELIEGDAQVTETATGRRAVLGDAVVTMDSHRSITVSVPAGHTVTVHTRGLLRTSPGEYRTLGISALPQYPTRRWAWLAR